MYCKKQWDRQRDREIKTEKMGRGRRTEGQREEKRGREQDRGGERSSRDRGIGRRERKLGRRTWARERKTRKGSRTRTARETQDKEKGRKDKERGREQDKGMGKKLVMGCRAEMVEWKKKTQRAGQGDKERKGTAGRTALEEKTNCDGHQDREMEKEKIEREREQRRGSQLDRGIQ